MAFAIFTTGGKQYKAAIGEVLFIEKLEGKAGDKVNFDKVLMIDQKVGAPYLNGASVGAVIEKQGLGEKLRIVKFKAKKHHLKQTGHRQPYTKVKIESING